MAQQVEEGEPAAAVGLGVGILRRVAPGGVDQHGLVGEPPVAIARAADALHGRGRVVAGERKLQAGIDERRRLAGAGRPDDEIPGQIVEGVRARLAGSFQDAERVLHLLLENRRVAVFGDRLGHRLGDLRGRAAAGNDAPGDGAADRKQDHSDDDAAGRARSSNGCASPMRDERPGEPDERREDEGAENAEPDPEPGHHGHRERLLARNELAPSVGSRDRDFDAPVLRLVRLGVVRRDRIVGTLPCHREPLGCARSGFSIAATDLARASESSKFEGKATVWIGSASV